MVLDNPSRRMAVNNFLVMNRSRINVLIKKFNVHGEREPLRIVQKVASFKRVAVPQLIDTLNQSTNIRLRRWSAAALGQIGGTKVINPLLKALTDPNMSVNLQAITALERVAPKKLGQKLIPLMKHSSGGVRINAIDTLGRLKYRPSGKYLIAATKDQKWYVRQAAARAIGNLKFQKGRPVLESLQKCDSRKAVRDAARDSLRMINR